MKSRLNITIDESLLRQVKKYAMKNRSSVSKLVEDYFEQLVKPVQRTSLIGFLKENPAGDYPEGFDYTEAYYKKTGKP